MVFVESVTTLFIYTYVCGADKVINFVLANSGPLPRESTSTYYLSSNKCDKMRYVYQYTALHIVIVELYDS